MSPLPRRPHARRSAWARKSARIGRALKSRGGDVLEVVLRLTHDAGGDILDEAVAEQLQRVCTIATVWVADWMAGGNPEDGLDAGREAWELFGALAAHRAAPLHEVTKRCLRWRDGVTGSPRRSPRRMCIPGRDPSAGPSMTQVTLDATLVRMCEVYEAERPQDGRRALRSTGEAGLHGHPRPADGPAQPDPDPRPGRPDARAGPGATRPPSPPCT